jgi:hypothetical protein
MSKAKSLPLPELTAGDELIKSSNHFYAGVEFVAAGFMFALIPAVGNMGVDDSKPFNLLGGALGFIGMAVICESHIHLRQAGLLLNKNGIGISIPIGGQIARR